MTNPTPSAPEPASETSRGSTDQAAPGRAPQVSPAIKLSEDQQQAHDAALAWWREAKRACITLGGYGGTGKTTLMAVLASSMRRERRATTIAFVAYTGKAASVLGRKIARAGARGAGDFVGTIHSLIYTPVLGEGGVITGWTRKPELEQDVIFLDEASMAGEDIFNDLLSYGKPILAVGDHGQLPPINGTFNLMAAPELRLERIHRQALDNPIIRASMQVRETGRLEPCNWGGKVVKGPSLRPTEMLTKAEIRDALFLCGTNRTRKALNAKVRAVLGYAGLPQAGEKVICLRNDRKKGLFNGMTGTLTKYEEVAGSHWHQAAAVMDGEKHPTAMRLNWRQFGAERTFKGTEIPGLDPRAYGDLFDFGYAMTTHKAQGSESPTVVVYEECGWMETEDLRRRWLYTAYTRAAERLIVVGR